MKNRYTGKYNVFFDGLYIVDLYDGNSYEEALEEAKRARANVPNGWVRLFCEDKELEF